MSIPLLLLLNGLISVSELKCNFVCIIFLIYLRHKVFALSYVELVRNKGGCKLVKV